MILARSGVRNLLRHPWQTVLAVMGVALGVAVVTAVDLANATAQRAFRVAAQTIAGRATHQVVGGPTLLPESLYRTIRVQGRFRGCAPLVEGAVQTLPSRATLQLIGIDPFAEPPVRSFTSRFPDLKALTRLMVAPGSVMLVRSRAQALGLRVGDLFPVEVRGERKTLQLVGFLEAEDELTRLGLESVLVADIATAQEVLSLEGRLSRIDLVLPEGGAGELLLNRIRGFLPAGATVVPAGAKVEALEKMTRAFRLNLSALSLLALVVGMLLIYNITTFSVIRRRKLIGLLRAVGVTRREILLLVLGETLVIALVGTGCGLVAGILLGEELTRLVARSINDLYFLVEIRGVPLPAATPAKGALLGIGATLAAALPAAREATSAPPRAALSRSDIEEKRRKEAPLAAVGGAATVLAGGGLLCFPSLGIPGSFAGLFAIIVGYALVIPGAVVVLAGALRPVMAKVLGVTGKMAARGVVLSLSRTGVATAALVVAVSATIGVGIMVGSFRLTVQSWLKSWLQADLYVRSAQASGGRNVSPLDPELVRRLALVPGAREVSVVRRGALQGSDGTTQIMAVQLHRETFLRYPFKEGGGAGAWESFRRGDSVLVTEPFAYRRHLHAGGMVRLRTDRGETIFPISGVVYDYGSDAGTVILARSAYLGYFDDPGVDGISFYARPGVTLAELTRQVRERGAGFDILVISNQELRRATLAVFDRTFAITGVLRLLTLVVAFVGILSALMAMQMERARELAVLRCLGLTPSRVWGVICAETSLLGLMAGALSLPLGMIQAYVLIFVINLRSFGWTMQPYLDPKLLFQAVLLALVASLLAGIYPSLRIARTPPSLALKEEE